SRWSATGGRTPEPPPASMVRAGRGLFDDQPAGATGAAAPVAGAPGAPAAGGRSPLAERMRPRTLDEVVGHPQVLGPDAFLRRAIAADRVPSLIFWGPPG